jgi:hypothetical protein
MIREDVFEVESFAVILDWSISRGSLIEIEAGTPHLDETISKRMNPEILVLFDA